MKSYRADVDGLRAFAVVAVIANHANADALPAGNLGVDIFFVISGYVITLSLVSASDVSLGSFLKEFYTRRVKRLMPALIVCVTLSSLALALIDPKPSVSLWTGAAALLGAANIYLYFQQLDYFATDVAFNAFTHTWSLGVEEQFYLVLPIILWLGLVSTQKLKPNTFVLCLLAFLSMVSLGLFLLFRTTDPVASFYLIHTRFWELGAGVLLALLTRLGLLHEKTAAPSRWLGWQTLFLVMLVASLAFSGWDDRVLTLLVVIGTLAAIASPDRTPLLTNSTTVYLGKISYSLYLWHWPLLVFATLSPAAFWASPPALIILLLITSTLSYHLIEQPFRHKAWSFGQRFDLGYGVAATAMAIGFVLFVPFQATVSRPMQAQGNDNMMYLEQAFLPLPSGAPQDPTCVVDDGLRRLRADTFDSCTFFPGKGNAPMIWAMGDSHAGHFQSLFVQLHKERGIGFHLVETPGQFFPPASGMNADSRLALLDRMMEQISPGDVVFLSRLFVSRSEPPEVLPDVDEWLAGVEKFASDMARRNVAVVVAGPPPMYRFRDIRACNREIEGSCAVRREKLTPVILKVEAKLVAVAKRLKNLRILKSFKLLCPEDSEKCVPSVEGVFTMRDRDHLNVFGASLLKHDFVRLLGRQQFNFF